MNIQYDIVIKVSIQFSLKKACSCVIWWDVINVQECYYFHFPELCVLNAGDIWKKIFFFKKTFRFYNAKTEKCFIKSYFPCLLKDCCKTI